MTITAKVFYTRTQHGAQKGESTDKAILSHKMGPFWIHKKARECQNEQHSGHNPHIRNKHKAEKRTWNETCIGRNIQWYPTCTFCMYAEIQTTWPNVHSTTRTYPNVFSNRTLPKGNLLTLHERNRLYTVLQDEMYHQVVKSASTYGYKHVEEIWNFSSGYMFWVFPTLWFVTNMECIPQVVINDQRLGFGLPALDTYQDYTQGSYRYPSTWQALEGDRLHQLLYCVKLLFGREKVL